MSQCFMTATTLAVTATVGGAGIGLAQTAVAGPKRPLQIEDYYRIRSIAQPEISPDGRWVAYLVTDRIEATGAEPSAAWMVATAGGEPRRISGPGEKVQSISWAAGGRIRYVVDRVVRSVLPSRIGAAQVESLGPARLREPGGAGFVTLRQLPINSPPPRFESEFARRHFERFRGSQFDWLEFQRDGGPFPAPNPAAAIPAEIYYTPGAGQAERQLTRLLLIPRDLVWSPTGEFLAFAADSSYRVENRYGRNDVWTVDRTGRTRRLTTDDGFDNRTPAVSPDGRWIAVVRTVGTDQVIRARLDHGGPTDLALVPVDGGAIRNLTPDWDLQVGSPSWSPDGRFLYFSAGIGGERHLFRIAPTGGAVEQVTRGPRRLGSVSFDSAMRRMAYLVGHRDAPAELFVAEIDGSGERQLTRINAPLLGEVALSPSERIDFASADGTPIEGWVTLPYQFAPNGGPYPLIVASHGGPHSASGYEFDFKTQYFAANGYLVLETNFRSSTGYGERFLWGTWGAWGTKDGEDVIAGVDHVLRSFPADRSRIGATGHSYGGFMTNWLISQYPDRFAAAITGAGISNWMSDYGTADVARTKETEFFGTPWEEDSRNRMIRQSPLTYAGRVRAPTLFVHGELDQRVPYEEAEQMYVALKKNGVPAKMVVYQGQHHGIRGAWNVVHRMLVERAWWDRWLKRGGVE
jgi:dipeptidyl aminopeptidase/acylaminoacyl peptidase